MSKKVDLQKILLDNGIRMTDSENRAIIRAMREACSQILDIASDVAEYDGGGTFDNGEHLESVPIKINKRSIRNAINQIK